MSFLIVYLFNSNTFLTILVSGNLKLARRRKKEVTPKKIYPYLFKIQLKATYRSSRIRNKLANK